MKRTSRSKNKNHKRIILSILSAWHQALKCEDLFSSEPNINIPFISSSGHDQQSWRGKINTWIFYWREEGDHSYLIIVFKGIAFDLFQKDSKKERSKFFSPSHLKSEFQRASDLSYDKPQQIIPLNFIRSAGGHFLLQICNDQSGIIELDAKIVWWKVFYEEVVKRLRF